MTLRYFLLCLWLLSLSACVTPSQSEAEMSQRLDQLQQQVSSLESSISTSVTSACKANASQFAAEIHRELRDKLDASEKRLRSAKKKTAALEKKCAAGGADKILLGEVEEVYFEDAELNLDARIDTGAETSSLGVYALTEFERDGKSWVRFKFENLKKRPFYEYRIRDDVRIKQRKQDDLEQRFEIKIDIKLGNKRYRKQVFNLADRSHLDYQVLLGRSFIRDIALVDVSLKKQHSKRK